MRKILSIWIVLTIVLSSLTINVWAQSQAISISVRNVPVRTALAQIRQAANVHFVYEEKNIADKKTVSLQYPQRTALKTILSDLCQQIGLTYEVNESVVLLYPNKKQGLYNIHIQVVEKESGEPLPMATCGLTPVGAYTITDADGLATFKNIPNGTYTLRITYVGYEDILQEVEVSCDMNLNFRIATNSLALKEVVVVAKQNAAGESTSSIIGRQAIDHLQAMSLSDVMQLIPGHLMETTDLTSQSNLQLRTLVNNNTNAFGASIIVDGMPMSNNGAMTQGGFSSTAFVGTDLRQISADDIESVEVIRGIPSAEYGDLTSGLVIVHSKIGHTPWQFKGKINPGTMNYSLGKGFRLNNNAGVLNFNIDYAKAWGDPRQKTKSFNRYTLSVGYSRDFSKKWHTDTKIRYMLAKDWNGNDPDAVDDGTYVRNNNQTISLTHNGKISMNKRFSRTINYTIGASYNSTVMKKTAIVTNSSGLLPILTATETGYYSVPFEQSSYQASGGSISRPGNVYAKLSNTFFIQAGKTNQNFKMGVDYNYDWNNARGYYNDDDRYPLQPNSNGRPRAFSDIPGIHKMSAYFEDNFRWNLSEKQYLKLQAGVRFTALQPWAEEATFALSPRINASFAVNDWLNLRGGFGLNSKTPGLDYLYPDKKYTDRVAANYMPQNDEAAQILLYHTYVYDVQRTKGLKNATNRKWEVGFDIKLPNDRKMSVIAYHDKTPNGFGAATEYLTYTANYYTPEQGLIISSGQATEVDWNNPARTDTIFTTTGKIGNTNVSVNKGIEIDFDLGEIPALHTSFYLTGAYQETKTYSTDLNGSNPSNLPTSYQATNTTPFKLVYPSAQSYSLYRRFTNTLRIVTNIPTLRMVASFAAQAIWYNYSNSYSPAMDPIGWIDTDLSYHEITEKMLADEEYTIKGVSLSDQRKSGTDNVATKAPITWLLSGRLTKELGNIGGISFYANNLLFYEPFLRSSNSSTLTQRNTGNFSFGVELFFNL
ncbi:MAG: TonB-dependent receptor [Bacteroides sp.]|nr:TonB-dependent receptor [Bacteroides sp.]